MDRHRSRIRVGEVSPVECGSTAANSAPGPEISFSHDLLQNDDVPLKPYVRSSSPSFNIDFDLCVLHETLDRVHSSSVEELFYDGKILLIEIKRALSPPPPLPPPAAPKIEKPVESKAQVPDKSPFWLFKRSSSLNCSSGGYARNLCLLSRSHSTGSSVKRSQSSNGQKQSLLKCLSSTSGSVKQSLPIGHQKPLLKKGGHGYYSSGVILNIAPTNMFGLGFMFSGKDRSTKK